MEKRALRTGRRSKQMHYTHSHYLADGPCRLPSLCTAQGSTQTPTQLRAEWLRKAKKDRGGMTRTAQD